MPEEMRKAREDLRKDIFRLTKQLESAPPRKLDSKGRPLGRPLTPTEINNYQTEKEAHLHRLEELDDIKAADRVKNIQHYTRRCTDEVLQHTTSIGRALQDQMQSGFEALVPLLKPKKNPKPWMEGHVVKVDGVDYVIGRSYSKHDADNPGKAVEEHLLV